MERVITKREATKADYEFAKKVHHDGYHDLIVKRYGSWDENMQDGFFDKTWNQGNHSIILESEIPCGYCMVESKPDHIYVNELVISPKFQGKGIGSSILRGITDEAKLKKLPVRLQVYKENEAQHLYRRLGFKDIGKTDTHFQMELDPSNS